MYIIINISLLFRRESDKASEKKRNICGFKEIMRFFSSYILNNT